jgi:hypothetical protein
VSVEGKDVLFPFRISQGARAHTHLPTIKAWIAALERCKELYHLQRRAK